MHVSDAHGAHVYIDSRLMMLLWPVPIVLQLSWLACWWLVFCSPRKWVA